MDLLSSSARLPSPSMSFSDVTDAVSSIPFDRFASSIDSVTPDLDDVQDLAVAVADRGRRIGVRTVRTSVRAVRRNPRVAVSVLAGLIALTAVAIFLKRRNETTDIATAN